MTEVARDKVTDLCEGKGIFTLTAEDVFVFVESPKDKDLNPVLSASFFEIYCDEIFDLLENKTKFGKSECLGLTEKGLHKTEEFLKFVEHANASGK
jgi:kinesin family protein 2/24